LNLLAYINTDEVLAVPLPPTNKIELLHIAVLGYIKIKFISNSALNESIVGINN